MKRALMLSIGVVLVAALLCSVATVAQGPEYGLKDYMPQTVGSKWIMKSTGAQGEVTNTYEVLAARDVDGQQAMPIVMKTADGTITSGTLEAVSADKLTMFGTIFGRRGAQAGGEPVTVIYQPAAVFPGKLRVGQSEQSEVKSTMGGQPVTMTMKLELAAVETVTVPKGTFENCLKLVYTTVFAQGERKRTIWYAKGVGMVKREDTRRADQPPRVSELTDYALAP